jgi:putative membrane protein
MRAVFRAIGLLAMAAAGLILVGCAGQDRDTADDTAYYGSSGAFAGQAPGADAGVAPIAPGDLDFLTQASYGGLAQVDYASLAEQLAVDPAVREHERLMTADYGPANDELADLARALGLTAPSTPDAGRVQTAHALQTLAGPSFDRAYVAVERVELRMQVGLYEAEAAGGHDPRLRDFAERRLPMLMHQRARVEELARTRVSSAR